MQYVAALIVLLVLTGCSDQASPLPGPSLVAVHATWCQPCQRDKPLLVEVAREFPVTEIDVDTQRELASWYGMSVLPTYIVMDDGNVVVRTSNLSFALSTLRSLNQTRQ